MITSHVGCSGTFGKKEMIVGQSLYHCERPPISPLQIEGKLVPLDSIVISGEFFLRN